MNMHSGIWIGLGSLLLVAGCAGEAPVPGRVPLSVTVENVSGSITGREVLMADIETASAERVGSQGTFHLGSVAPSDPRVQVTLDVCPIDDLRENPYGEDGEGRPLPVAPDGGAAVPGPGFDEPGFRERSSCDQPAVLQACAEDHCFQASGAGLQIELADTADGRRIIVDATGDGSELHLSLRYTEEG